MRVGSLFSGIGGLDLGLERAGFTTAWLVENDKHCQSVLRKRFPNAEVLGDVREVGGVDNCGRGKRKDGIPPGGPPSNKRCVSDAESTRPNGNSDNEEANAKRRTLTPVSVICGGFPCQDYSVAGKRGGLVGDRGALWWEMHRIIAECRPTWVVGENVPGLLSSNGGADFLTIIHSLVELGYGCAWAVLDSQYFGVAQRRRRLFIVGHSRGIPRPEILALSEGMFGHPAPSREAGQEVAGSIGGGSEASGKRRNDLDNHGAYPLAFHATQDPISGEQCPSLGSNMTAGVLPFDTTQVTSQANRSNPKPGDPCHPLAAGAHAPAVAIQGGENHGGKKQLGPGLDESGTMYTLGCREVHGVSGTTPRRLTPIECERLQGFPDNWTQVEHRGKPMADGPRYRMMGNAVTVNVVEWIGRRIMEAEK